MEKINIAEILADCPKGTKLYSPIFGEVYLDKIRPHLAIIVTTDKYKEEFLYDGRYGMNGECMLFPSKDQRDWSKFQRPFTDGDVIYVCDEYSGVTFTYVVILKQIKGGQIYSYCFYSYKDAVFGTYDFLYNNYNIRFATEEEKQKLFDAIKSNGYYWNEKTKTLEKLIEPKFKVGDKIKCIKNGNICEIIKILSNCYITNHLGSDITIAILFDKQDEFELVHVEPKFKVGNKVRHKTNHNVVFTIDGIEEDFYTCAAKMTFDFNEQDNYELVPDKFDLTTLKPFESRVLVRNADGDLWKPAIFGCYVVVGTDSYYYVLGGICWRYCIPYEGNEHLLSTNKDCDEFYKNWTWDN